MAAPIISYKHDLKHTTKCGVGRRAADRSHFKPLSVGLRRYIRVSQRRSTRFARLGFIRVSEFTHVFQSWRLFQSPLVASRPPFELRANTLQMGSSYDWDVVVPHRQQRSNVTMAESLSPSAYWSGVQATSVANAEAALNQTGGEILHGGLNLASAALQKRKSRDSETRRT